MDLIDNVKSILQAELNIDEISGTAKQEDYCEWDSLTYLQIIAALEEAFNLEINNENINKFTSVANIVKEIQCQKQ